jgi:hypothetical protein
LKVPVLAGTRFADSPALGNNFWRVTGVADFCTADSPHPDPGQSAVQFLRRVHNCLGSVCSLVFDLRTVWDYTRGQSAIHLFVRCVFLRVTYGQSEPIIADSPPLWSVSSEPVVGFLVQEADSPTHCPGQSGIQAADSPPLYLGQSATMQ